MGWGRVSPATCHTHTHTPRRAETARNSVHPATAGKRRQRGPPRHPPPPDPFTPRPLQHPVGAFGGGAPGAVGGRVPPPAMTSARYSPAVTLWPRSRAIPGRDARPSATHLPRYPRNGSELGKLGWDRDGCDELGPGSAHREGAAAAASLNPVNTDTARRQRRPLVPPGVRPQTGRFLSHNCRLVPAVCVSPPAPPVSCVPVAVPEREEIASRRCREARPEPATRTDTRVLHTEPAARACPPPVPAGARPARARLRARGTHVGPRRTRVHVPALTCTRVLAVVSPP